MTILPNEIDQSSLRPRFALAIDRSTGNQNATTATPRVVLLLGQGLSTVVTDYNVVRDLLSDADAAAWFGAGSELDIAARAAFAAWPSVTLRGMAVEEPGGAVAAAATLTAGGGTATAASALLIDIGRTRVRVPVAAGDTDTVLANAISDAITALPALPVGSTTALKVATVTAKGKGTYGNSISMSTTWERDCGLTVTQSPGTGLLASGSGVPDFTNALAAIARSTHDLIVLLTNDATTGAAGRDFVEEQRDAEHGRGQIAIQATKGTLSAATALAGAINGWSNVVLWLPKSVSHYAEIAAATAAIISSSRNPAMPFNGLVVPGLGPTPEASQPIDSELDTALYNGVTPLLVIAGGRVVIQRAVVTYTTTPQNARDYSNIDLTRTQIDYAVRDRLRAMWADNYQRKIWADDDPNALLPSEVATPAKVKADIANVLRACERDGWLQHVEDSIPYIQVSKVGAQCRVEIGTDKTDGLHQFLGRLFQLVLPIG